MFTSAHTLSAPATSDPTVEGARRLFARVIRQALDDHAAPTRRDEVDAFFGGPVFARYCALLGWDDDEGRRRVQAHVARRRHAR